MDGEKLLFFDKLKDFKWVKKMKKKNIDKYNWFVVYCVIIYFYEKVSKMFIIEFLYY